MTYFASGSNAPVEIQGFARIGHPVGVSCAHLKPAGEQALHQLPPGLPTFVDSGAFSEADFPEDGPPVIVRPMTRAQWDHVMGVYERLARSRGSSLYVVAPDCVGDQAETLRRLRRYAPVMRRVRKLGTNIIVPVQRGVVRQAEFDRQCAAVLGFDDYIRGVPSKKKATSFAQYAAFLREARPKRVHLLGMGIRNRSFPRFAAVAAEVGAELFCDSCLIKGSVGKTNGRINHPAERKGGPRIYTRAQQLAQAMIAAGLSHVRDPRELAIPLAFACIDDEARRWATIQRALAGVHCQQAA